MIHFTQNRHKDELTLTFDRFSMFQKGVIQNIRTVMQIVGKTEAYTLTGFMDQGSSQMEVLVQNISELDKDSKSDWLHIYVLNSMLNVRAGEPAIGEVIVRSPEDLEAHMVEI